MDQSILVGLITGTRAYPQDDLSLDSKVTIILYAHNVLKGEMENLVTGSGFKPFHEFASSRDGYGYPIAYKCVFPDQIAAARVGLIFSVDTPRIQRKDKEMDIERFIRHSVLLTTKGILFWLTERCEINYKKSDQPGPIPDTVTDVHLVPLDFENLRRYLELFPSSFLRILGSFVNVAKMAIEVREERQKRACEVLNKLTKMNDMISLVKFVYESPNIAV